MSQLLPGIVMGLLVLGGLAVLPAIWRGTSPFLKDEGSAGLAWFWGERMRRGMVRGILAANLTGGGLAVASIGLGLNDGQVGPVARVGLWLALVGFVLMAAIVLVNQPKLLVPPSLRDQPGALSRSRSAR